MLNLILLIWLAQFLGFACLWLYWWQTKEYRWDRFKAFLLYQGGWRKLLLLPFLVKLVFGVVLLFWPDVWWHNLFWLSLSGLALFFTYQALSGKLRRPHFTGRLLLTFFSTLLLIAAGYILLPFALSRLIIWEFIGWLALFFANLFLQILSNIFTNTQIKRAQEIVDRLNPLAIGITGSFGKTTTKEFIRQMLVGSYQVLATKKNQNTAIGVARQLLNNLRARNQVLVIEMGAYRSGEIRKIAAIVQPQIGLITGIAPQHLELFGSLEAIKQAKFELIETLPSGGQALFNFSCSHCRSLARQATKLDKSLEVFQYGRREKNKDFPGGNRSLIIQPLEVSFSGMKFKVVYQDKERTLTTNILGVRFLENLAGAILVARQLKVGWEEITRRCQNLSLPAGTMQVKKLGETTIIDDSYNASLASFQLALETLAFFQGQKVVITPGIIELGQAGQKIHRQLSEQLAKVVDKVFLTDRQYYADFQSGLGEEKLTLLTAKNLVKLDKARQGKTVILVEGRIPAAILQHLNL